MKMTADSTGDPKNVYIYIYIYIHNNKSGKTVSKELNENSEH